MRPLAKTLSPASPILRCVLAATLALAASACGNKRDDADPSPARPGDTGAAPAPRVTEKDLGEVCNGKALPGAKAYSKTAAANHTIRVFQSANDKGAFVKDYVRQLRDFEARKPEDVELVACVQRTAATKTETCNFDDKPPPHYLDMFQATYELTLREATTANVLATKTVSLPAGGCPMFHSFKKTRESQYPSTNAAVTELVKAHILPAPAASGAPAAAPPPPDPMAPTLSDHDLEKVCYDIPSATSAAYTKAKGTVSPLAMFYRYSENQAFYHSSADALRPWKTEKAEQYQLIGCVTRTSRTKKKECKFDERKPVRVLELHSAVYDFSVREAQTGKVLATKTVTFPGESRCPTIWMFRSNRDFSIPSPDKEFAAFAKPFAEP